MEWVSNEILHSKSLKSPDYCSRAGSIPASGTIDTAAKKPCCVCLVRCDSLRVCRNDVCDHVV